MLMNIIDYFINIYHFDDLNKSSRRFCKILNLQFFKRNGQFLFDSGWELMKAQYQLAVTELI